MSLESFIEGRKKGAAKERARIRRALRGLLFVLETASGFSGIQAETCASAARVIDAATKAPRTRRRG